MRISITDVAVNFVLAALIFIINSFLGTIQFKHPSMFQYGEFAFASDEGNNLSGNFFLKIINPTIFMAVVSAVMQHFKCDELCRSLWMLIPMYWFLRLIYIIFRNYIRIINKRFEIITVISSIALGELVLYKLILPLLDLKQPIFIPLDEFRNAIWFAIIAYVGKTIWDICRNSLSSERVYPAKQREKLINDRYDVFSKKYGNEILQLANELYPGGIGKRSDLV